MRGNTASNWSTSSTRLNCSPFLFTNHTHTRTNKMADTLTRSTPQFTTSDLLRWHPHELELQETRGFADAVFDGPGSLSAGLIHGSYSFLRQLQLFPLTTLDSDGRPWVSLLTSHDGQEGFIESLAGEGQEEQGVLRLRVAVPEGTPFREHWGNGKKLTIDPASSEEKERKMLAASVGVILHNRRRNKYDGWIAAVKEAEREWEIDMVVTATVGNCPKYINTRTLAPSSPTSPEAPRNAPTTSLTHAKDTPIPTPILDAITQADLIYLGTLHTGSTSTWYTDRSKLGCNIRGGRRGFLRHYWDTKRQRHCILLPDFSGNRFLQSLGNIAGDPVAGLAIPVFKEQGASDVAYLTCDAEVLSGDEAAKVLRGFAGVVKLWITGFAYVQGALPLVISEDIGWSPYNPPIRYAASEPNGPQSYQTFQEEATLYNIIHYTPQILTFQWRLPTNSLLQSYKPGQHIIVDAHNLLDTRVKLYNHMSQFPGGEKELNDDGTRSWTISAVDVETNTFEITLRRVPRGGVTPNLFNMSCRAVDTAKESGGQWPAWTPKLKVLGIAGDFTLPKCTDGGAKLMYLVSGIGITPFLSHLAGVGGGGGGTGHVQITAIVAIKQDELDPTLGMIRRALETGRAVDVTLRVHILLRGDTGSDVVNLLDGYDATARIWNNVRFTKESLSAGMGDDQTSFHLPAADFKPFKDTTRTRRFYICGSGPFQDTAQQALQRTGAQDDEIVMEKFTY